MTVALAMLLCLALRLGWPTPALAGRGEQRTEGVTTLVR